MGEVYSLASSVLVWLGRLDPKERYALEDIRDALEGTNGVHSPGPDKRQSTAERQFWERQSRIRQQAEAGSISIPDLYGYVSSILGKFLPKKGPVSGVFDRKGTEEIGESNVEPALDA